MRTIPAQVLAMRRERSWVRDDEQFSALTAAIRHTAATAGRWSGRRRWRSLANLAEQAGPGTVPPAFLAALRADPDGDGRAEEVARAFLWRSGNDPAFAAGLARWRRSYQKKSSSLGVVAMVALAAVVAGALGEPPGDSAGPIRAAALRAAARWCCDRAGDRYGNDRFYWPGSRQAFVAARRAAGGGVPGDLAHTGGNRIEVTVRAAGPAPVRLLGVRVLLRDRRPAPRPGLELVLPCDCTGGRRVRDLLSTDLDQAVPSVRPAGGPVVSVGPADQVMVLRADSRDCDCRFDLELRWRSGGRDGTTVLDDGGRPFRVVGRAGRPVVEP